MMINNILDCLSSEFFEKSKKNRELMRKEKKNSIASKRHLFFNQNFHYLTFFLRTIVFYASITLANSPTMLKSLIIIETKLKFP